MENINPKVYDFRGGGGGGGMILEKQILSTGKTLKMAFLGYICQWSDSKLEMLFKTVRLMTNIQVRFSELYCILNSKPYLNSGIITQRDRKPCPRTDN